MSDILTRPALLAWFERVCTPRAEWRVGAEFEKQLTHLSTGRRIRFDEADGVQRTLEQLVDERWSPTREGAHLIGLTSPGMATVTLEPGGQIELSTDLHESLHALRAELDAHLARLNAIFPADRALLGVGYAPWEDIEAFPFVPKGRYAVMGPYLADKGALAHHMMKGTCSVQATFDFESEEDAGRKLAAALELTPLISAWLANSPLRQGAETGYRSYRGACWLETDPARTGVLDDVVGAEGGFRFERYLDYLLGVPMMFRYGGNGYISAGGQTFGAWMQTGDGPGWKDWDLHLTSVFPEVRLKNFIEVRGADAVSADLSLAAIALWRGILYGALDEALELADRLRATGPRAERHLAGMREGLLGTVGGTQLRAHARTLYDLAAAGLRAQGRADEVPLLKPLERYLDGPYGCPADELLERVRRGDSVAQLTDFLRY